MSKKTELGVFQNSIAIPGVRFTRTALEFDKVDKETLVQTGAFLQAVDACSAWWWGDFLVAYCGYELKEEEAENGAYDEITRGDREKQYASQYGLICDREAKTLWHWRGVAKFYNSSRRREELSHGHHIEAQGAAAGDASIADHWLDLAEKHHWSCSQLRAAIRKAKRQESEPDEPMPQMILPMELMTCRVWAIRAKDRVQSIEINEAAAILREMQPILDYARVLTDRVNSEVGKLKRAAG
jgi:hypothetical protein